jgi:hypothetical protein
MPYEEELATYLEKLPELLADAGSYAVIRGRELLGVYGTYEDALKAGYARYGVAPFLVKQINAVEQVQYFTRELAPA